MRSAFPLSTMTLWGSCTCFQSLCGFNSKSALLHLEGLAFLTSSIHIGFLPSFHLPFPKVSWVLSEGIWWRYTIRGDVPGSLTPYALSTMSLCICSHLLRKEASMMMVEQARGLWVYQSVFGSQFRRTAAFVFPWVSGLSSFGFLATQCQAWVPSRVIFF